MDTLYIGAKGMTHACCWSHARRGFIDAIKVQSKAKAPNTAFHPTDEELSVGTPAFHPTDEDLSVGTPALERAVVLMDGLFAIDREACEQKLSLDDRHGKNAGAEVWNLVPTHTAHSNVLSNILRINLGTAVESPREAHT